MLNFVEFLHRLSNLLGGLVVAELPCLGEHGDVRWRVDFFKDHFHLVQESESLAALALHDLVDGCRVELDAKVAEGGLKSLEVFHAVRIDISAGSVTNL